jgi:hypothetical protein
MVLHQPPSLSPKPRTLLTVLDLQQLGRGAVAIPGHAVVKLQRDPAVRTIRRVTKHREQRPLALVLAGVVENVIEVRRWIYWQVDAPDAGHGHTVIAASGVARAAGGR